MVYSFEGLSSPQIDTKFANKMSSDTYVPKIHAVYIFALDYESRGDNTAVALATCIVLPDIS